MTAEEEIEFSGMTDLRIYHGPCKFELLKLMNGSLKIKPKDNRTGEYQRNGQLITR